MFRHAPGTPGASSRAGGSSLPVVLLLAFTVANPTFAHPPSPSATAGDGEIPADAVTQQLTIELPPFRDALPMPQVAKPSRTISGYCVPVLPSLCYPGALDVYDMPMLVITNHFFHTNLPPIEVWGYDGKYPGPTIEAKVGTPVLVNWINRLTNNGGMYPYWLPADTNLFHGGHDSGLSPQTIRTVVHLHGAAVLPRYDGYPTNWFRPGESDQYFYGNMDLNGDGETLWYHDHAIGVTANNVYAGLAGFYLLRAEDYDREHGISLPSGLPYEVPLVFQDRDFGVTTWTANGISHSVTNLFLAGPPWHQYAVVNGKVTPYLEVEPRPYRFRILNGTSFRALALKMYMTDAGGKDLKGTNVPAAPSFLVVGDEDGYLQSATNVSRIATMPGERFDVVIDFSPFANSSYTHITIKNAFGLAGAGGGGANADIVGPPYITNLMQFRVSLPLSTNGNRDIRIPTPLTQNWVTTESMVNAAMTNRPVTLDLTDSTGTLPFQGPPFNVANLSHPFALINMAHFDEPITDFPHAGDIEVWDIINLSNEAHPVHVHLLDFRVINRQRFASDTSSLTTPWGNDPSFPPVMVGKYIIDRLAGTLKPLAAYLSLNPGDIQPAQSYETGPKDVVRAAPFAVTRIVMQWPTNVMFYTAPSAVSGDLATAGRFVFHCHILDHEDNDMMRPLQLRPPWEPSLAFADSRNASPNGPKPLLLAYPYRLNQVYSLETTTNLTHSNWQQLYPTNPPKPFLDIPAMRWIQPAPPSKDTDRFYRVQAVLPNP